MSSKFSMFLVALLTGALLCLAACEEKRSESYYYTHPETLKVVLQQCQREDGTPETFTLPCATAYRAAVQMTKLSQAFMDNQTDFGQRILRSQIRAANIVTQLQAAESAHSPVNDLEKQLADEEQHINNLRAIVGLFIRM